MKVKDLEFKKLIAASKIEERIAALAAEINHDYKDKSPILLPVLNGSFMFASDSVSRIVC